MLQNALDDKMVFKLINIKNTYNIMDINKDFSYLYFKY